MLCEIHAVLSEVKHSTKIFCWYVVGDVDFHLFALQWLCVSAFAQAFQERGAVTWNPPDSLSHGMHKFSMPLWNRMQPVPAAVLDSKSTVLGIVYDPKVVFTVWGPCGSGWDW